MVGNDADRSPLELYAASELSSENPFPELNFDLGIRNTIFATEDTASRLGALNDILPEIVGRDTLIVSRSDIPKDGDPNAFFGWLKQQQVQGHGETVYGAFAANPDRAGKFVSTTQRGTFQAFNLKTAEYGAIILDLDKTDADISKSLTSIMPDGLNLPGAEGDALVFAGVHEGGHVARGHLENITQASPANILFAEIEADQFGIDTTHRFGVATEYADSVPYQRVLSSVLNITSADHNTGLGLTVPGGVTAITTDPLEIIAASQDTRLAVHAEIARVSGVDLETAVRVAMRDPEIVVQTLDKMNMEGSFANDPLLQRNVEMFLEARETLVLDGFELRYDPDRIADVNLDSNKMYGVGDRIDFDVTTGDGYDIREPVNVRADFKTAATEGIESLNLTETLDNNRSTPLTAAEFVALTPDEIDALPVDETINITVENGTSADPNTYIVADNGSEKVYATAPEPTPVNKAAAIADDIDVSAAGNSFLRRAAIAAAPVGVAVGIDATKQAYAADRNVEGSIRAVETTLGMSPNFVIDTAGMVVTEGARVIASSLGADVDPSVLDVIAKVTVDKLLHEFHTGPEATMEALGQIQRNILAENPALLIEGQSIDETLATLQDPVALATLRESLAAAGDTTSLQALQGFEFYNIAKHEARVAWDREEAAEAKETPFYESALNAIGDEIALFTKSADERVMADFDERQNAVIERSSAIPEKIGHRDTLEALRDPSTMAMMKEQFMQNGNIAGLAALTEFESIESIRQQYLGPEERIAILDARQTMLIEAAVDAGMTTEINGQPITDFLKDNPGQLDIILRLHADLEGSEAYTTIKENLSAVVALNESRERIEAGIQVAADQNLHHGQNGQNYDTYGIS